jgi:hypothetical protein
MEIPISMLCDKYEVNIANSQCTFIDYVIKPYLEEFGKICKGVLTPQHHHFSPL